MPEINHTAQILAAVASAQRRDDVVPAYRAAVNAFVPTVGWPAVDWPRVNDAILRRWSESGLRYIKNQAWQHKRAR